MPRINGSAREPVDPERFGGLTAVETRANIYGAERRVVLTHSPTLHTKQARGLDQTLAKAGAHLDKLAATLARGKTRRDRTRVESDITGICADTWRINTDARTKLETEIFGKRILITNRDHWTLPEVIAGYRSQSDAKFGFRQLKDPHVVSFSPMHHWSRRSEPRPGERDLHLRRIRLWETPSMDGDWTDCTCVERVRRLTFHTQRRRAAWHQAAKTVPGE